MTRDVPGASRRCHAGGGCHQQSADWREVAEAIDGWPDGVLDVAVAGTQHA